MPETIVCISGAKQTMAAWRSFIKHFTPHYSVVVFDLPGQGRAEICHGDCAVSFEEQQQVLLDIMEQTRRSTQVTLAAASWGTIVAAAVAASHPEKVDKMILGSFGVSTNDTILNLIQEGQELFNQGRIEEIAPLMINVFGQYVPEAQKRQMVDQFKTMDHNEFMSFYAHCEFVKQSKDIGKFIDLSRIQAKTLVICGEYDAILDHDGIKRASLNIPDCVYKLVPEAGHFLHWEKPAILNTYSDFLLAS
jgi:pimeloyl-ACP methyl ester carboxylesterase